MSKKVFISGSISLGSLSEEIKTSINKIIYNGFEIFVGDADGIDALVQKYCLSKHYFNVTVYSISSYPRFIASDEFRSKKVDVSEEIKKERERQQEKDKMMTIQSDYSLVIWNGKSKGSYANILRAFDSGKQVKVYLNDRFLTPEETTRNEIDFIYRTNNGYTASEVVSFLRQGVCDLFSRTQDLNKYLLQNSVVTKENGVYIPKKEYEELFFVNRYKGKVTGIRFKNEFIDWIETTLKKPSGVQESLF